MPKAPPNIQLETLLAFLKGALRADPVLLEHLGSPDSICRSTLEHDPLKDVDSKGIPRMFRTEMPVLAIWKDRSERVRGSAKFRQGVHTRWGLAVTMRMMYLHKVYHGSATLSPASTGERISNLVEWQMRGALEAHKYDGVDGGFDLLTDGNIESVEMGATTMIGDKTHDGFAAEITMIHYSAPYQEVAPMVLQTIDLELHLDDVVPAVAGPIIQGDIVIPTS